MDVKRKALLPELLAPAGDFESLVAAVKAGADAVYVGGRAFSARAYAKNFDIQELSRAADYVHTHGVKLYVTVNTLVFDKELAELSDYAEKLYDIGVDAVICADLGAVAEIRRRAPRLPIHASTQMSVHNTLGADAAAQLGCERVVLARELSLADIKRVVERAEAEVEVFVHGALCVSHSGQCLMSSLVGGRSGNRGECAQPCRLSYNGAYPLSLCDLSLCSHVKELIDSGVASLKIEGRMKSAEYVFRVTSVYRRLLDEARCASENEKDELSAVFSRSGFTDGYFVGQHQKAMTGVRSTADKERTERLGKMSFAPERVKLTAQARFVLGEASTLTLRSRERSYTATGEMPTAAISAPLDERSLKERISKMGATFFSLSEQDIAITLEEGINLPPAAINELRRCAVQGLLHPERADAAEKIKLSRLNKENKDSEALTTAQFFDCAAYAELKSSKACKKMPDAVFLPISYEGDFDKREGVSIPPVITDGELDGVRERLALLRERGASRALVSNLGAIPLAKELGFEIYGDFRLNVTNSLSKEVYTSLGVYRLILSPELTLPMARDIGGGEIVMGRIPLMLTERCFIKENFGCKSCNKAVLVDRKGAKFPILREFSHRNLILNSALTYMGDKKDELLKNKITHAHFLFTVESADEIAKMLSDYEQGSVLSGVRRVGRREEQKPREQRLRQRPQPVSKEAASKRDKGSERKRKASLQKRKK